MSSKLLSSTYLKICDKTLFYAYFACLGQKCCFLDKCKQTVLCPTQEKRNCLLFKPLCARWKQLKKQVSCDNSCIGHKIAYFRIFVNFQNVADWKLPPRYHNIFHPAVLCEINHFHPTLICIMYTTLALGLEGQWTLARAEGCLPPFWLGQCSWWRK